MKKLINRTVSNNFYLAVSSVNKKISKFVAILLVVFTIAGSCLPRNQVLGYTYDYVDEVVEADDYTAEYTKYDTTTSAEFDMSAVAIEKEINSLRTSDSKTFRRVDGTYVVAVYDTAVHYMKDGVYEDIDNTLVYDIKSNSYQTKANRISISLPKTLDGVEPVSVTIGDVGVKWMLLGSSRVAIDPIEKEQASDDKMNLDRVSSKATYASAKDNVVLEYILNGMSVKENIILSCYQKNFTIGFRYDLSGLTLSLDDSGTWVFVDATGKAIFTLDALWMSDSKGDISENVGLSVKEIEIGVYELTITPDDEWLSTATYPVIIDPSLSSATVSMTVEDAYVYSGNPNANYSTQSYLKLAGLSEYLFYKSLLKFTLPSQLSGRIVTYAHMYLTSYTKTNDRELVVQENNSGFTTSSVTWNTAPTASTAIVDYHITGDATTYIFDITDPVSRWNEGISTNYGFTLKDKQICEANNYVRSTEYTGTTSDPTIVIGYVDQQGLKDYWTYQSQSAGRAGTGYVADYTGMMTWVRSDINFETAKQSFGLSMVYNVFNRSQSLGYGSGWQTNYNLTVAYDSGSNKYFINDSTGYKEYFATFPTSVSTSLSDELQALAGEFGEFYGSEDGNGNILIQQCPSAPGTTTAFYLFTQNYILYKFVTNVSSVWYLDQIISEYLATNPLETTIDRVANYPNRIQTVTDDTGNYIDFDYNENGLMERMTLYVRQEDDYENSEVFDALSKVEYGYSWNSVVNTYLLDTTSYFWDYEANGFSATADEIVILGYDASARLNQACVTDKEKISYVYGSNSKISTISAYYDESLYSTLTYDYSLRKTEITDQDGNFIIYKFDAYGHTVNTTDSQGVTNAYEYLNLFKNYVLNENDEITEIVRYLDGSPNYQNNHKQISSSTPQTTDLNPVANSGFEYYVPTTFENWTYTSIYGQMIYGSSQDSMYGSKALAMSTYTSPAVGYFRQTIVLDKGSYTLSAYAKKTSPSPTSGSVYAEISGASMSSPSQKADNNGDWQLLQQYFTVANDNTSIQVRLYTSGTSTTGYFDSIQIKEGFITEAYQMLDNASFEYVTNTTVPGWSLLGNGVSRSAVSYDETIYAELLGSYGLQIIGDAMTEQSGALAYEFELTDDESGGEVTIGAWAKSEGTPLTSMSDDGYERNFCIRIMTFNISSELIESFDIQYDPTIEGWQYNFGSIPIAEDVSFLYIELVYQGEGTVWFDGVQITYQPAFTHTDYDKFGRVIKQIQSDGEVIEYLYSYQVADDRTPHQIKVNGVVQTTIDAEWGSLKAFATNNVEAQFDYNENGEVITSTIGESMSTSTTYAEAAYSQYLDVVTDEFGNETTYHYDILTGILEAIENAAGQDTHYIYDDEGKLIRVESQENYTDQNEVPDACVIYGYDELDRLEHIIMGCEEDGVYYYEIHYDSSGRMDNVRVVTASTSYDLMSYIYDDEGAFVSSRLSSQVYGNEDYLEFEYDDVNRINLIKYYNENDVLLKRFGYEYDSIGNLTVYTMYSSTGTVLDREFYQYNTDNQLVKTVDKDGNIIRYDYENGNLISLEFEFSGETVKSIFNIDESFLLQSSSFSYMDNIVSTLSRTYEISGLYRLDHLRLVTGSANIQTQFTYDEDSVRVDNVKIDVGEDSEFEHAIYYQYDELGNIEQIQYRENSVEVRKYNYTYDALNRLSVEKIYSNDDSCDDVSDTCYANLYQYDNKGNILATLKYKYADVPTITSEPSLLYTDDSSIPVAVYWNELYQPNDIYYLQLNNSPSYAYTFKNPTTGTPYNDVTCSLVGGNLNITQTGFYYRTYHATSPSGIDVTFNIMFFVGGYYQAKVYNYSAEWMDQLESYAIMDSNDTDVFSYTEYDEQGNPLEITNFTFGAAQYDHANLAWDGRQLAGITIRNADDSIVATIAYQYNDQGYRMSKTITIGSTVETYTYDLIGATVHRENYVKKVSGVTQDTYEILYLLDSDSSIIGFIYDGDPYYYFKDLQGNIISIIDASGNELVQYEYDAYGNIINNPDDPNGNIYEINPYTYRGYRYDLETGFYYLTSRYYNPYTGRFLNSSEYLGSVNEIQIKNLYSYCLNNPIHFVDIVGGVPIPFAEVNQMGHNVLFNYLFSKNHLNPHSLPPKGEPNSVGTQHDDDGNLVRERVYGPDGNAIIDHDHEQEPNAPDDHDHDWDWNKVPPRQPAHDPTKIIIAAFVLVGSATILAVLIADDATGVGAADDAFIPQVASACIAAFLVLISWEEQP